MKIVRFIALIACFGIAGSFATGCKKEEPKSAIEEAGDKMKEGAEEAGEAIKDGAEKAGDKIEEGMEEMGDKIEDATDK